MLRDDGTHNQVLIDDVLLICKYYIEEKVTGVFFAPLERIEHREAINLEIVSSLRAAGIAVVLLDRDAAEYPSRSDCDLVGIDNFGAGLALTQHLLSLGHRRVMFVAYPSPPSTTDLRSAGYREGLARGGMIPEKNWVQFVNLHKVKTARAAISPARQ